MWRPHTHRRALPNADSTSAELSRVTLTDADLTNADLTGVISGRITGTLSALPAGWTLATGSHQDQRRPD
jgi:uncharacterized protein YjbI with pentapeptide repeats